jgi:hypothetical protein
MVLVTTMPRSTIALVTTMLRSISRPMTADRSSARPIAAKETKPPMTTTACPVLPLCRGCPLASYQRREPIHGRQGELQADRLALRGPRLRRLRGR